MQDICISKNAEKHEYVLNSFLKQNIVNWFSSNSDINNNILK